MEVIETDSLTKSAKKKKILDEEAGKNCRKISDFFKTPDKNSEKQKQKNLLQFFPKSNIDKCNKTSETSIDMENLVDIGKTISTPTSSDKENSEVHDDNLCVTPEETKGVKNELNISDTICKTNEANSVEDYKSNSKKHKKHKKKKHLKDRKNDLSDSVVILSESSLSNQSSTSGDKNEEGTDQNGEESKPVICSSDRVEQSDSIKTELRQQLQSSSRSSGDSVLAVGKTDNTESQTIESAVNSKADKRRKRHKSKGNKTEKEDLADNSNDCSDAQALMNCISNKINEKGENETEPVEMEASKIAKKKSALKGKDMLNILKQIQTEDAENKKKRKHKKKHKHKVKGNEVHELANSEENNDEDVGENMKNLEEMEGEATLSGNSDNCDKVKVLAKETDIPESIKELKSSGQSTCNSKDKIVESAKPKAKPDKSSTKDKKQHTKKDGVMQKRKGLSYSAFSKSLKDKINKDSGETDKPVTKELSYTEYLKMLEKEETGNGDVNREKDESVILVDETEGNSAMEVDELEKNIDTTAGETDVTVNTVKQPPKKEIAQFFKCLTSTPDRDKEISAKNTKKLQKDIQKPKKVKRNSVKNAELKVETKGSTCNEIVKQTAVVKSSEITVKTNSETNEAVVGTISAEVSSKTALIGKKTQATLSFGKAGLTVAKLVKKTEELDDKLTSEHNKKGTCRDSNLENLETVSNIDEKVKPEKKKRGRKLKIDKPNLDTTESSVFMTPENKSRKRAPERQMEASLDADESADSGERRRSLRKRYKVEAFQMDADRKTPIKIKLKRCPKSSSSGEESSASVKKKKAKVKQTKAQALLEKAKQRKLKKNSKQQTDKANSAFNKPKEPKRKHTQLKTRDGSSSSEDSATRRSSRLEGKVRPSMEEVSLENIVISSSEDEASEVQRKRMKKKGKHKEKIGERKEGVDSQTKSTAKKAVEGTGTPKKQSAKEKGTPSKTRTPLKKSAVKLAPMFLMGKNKQAEPSPKKPSLDPEQARQRQQFLMSGVPDELRKQTATRMASQIDADYPPFPRDNHVQQVSTELVPDKVTNLNVWTLEHRELNERRFIVPCMIYPLSRLNGDLISTYQPTLVDLERIKNFHQHDVLPDEIVDLCLKEIAAFNPGYPAMSMYKALKHMKCETEKPAEKSESMLKIDMKGILEGTTDMVVIDDDDNSKKAKRKSLKLQKNEQKEEKKEAEEKSKVPACGLLWTEKYCPSQTSEVLGNSGGLKKLKSWLTEWKHVLDREARKARKLLLKKNKGKQISKKDSSDAWDDESDFDLDSEDSEEDDSLCNTMLLSGPHGCGKTSSVYALALELGFKVHEVNASSCRSGKQVLSQLQEATQSHQVSSQGNHTPRKNTALGDKPKPENKLPTAFTNLFKKADGKPQEKQEQKKEVKAGRKRKRHKSDKEKEAKHKTLQLVLEDSCSQNISRSLNLSSTTLILFDEVDVVFEEDKGFLSAIQNFMSNTKIPILLTTADPGFTHMFDGRYEQISFRRPSLASITSHLQAVALVEGVRTDPVLLGELAQHFNCDVRKCLTTLQFLVKTGGGHKIENREINVALAKILKSVDLDMENSQSSCQSDGGNMWKSDGGRNKEGEISENNKNVDNSDDDFVTIKPLKKRRRIFEENSNSFDASSQVTDQTGGVMSGSSQEMKPCVSVHSLGIETLYKHGNLSVANILTEGLKTRTTLSLRDMICARCQMKQSTNTDLFYNNMHLLLPFGTKLMDSVIRPVSSAHETKTRKRIRVKNDLYDSEASNDAVEGSDTESSVSQTENIVPSESCKTITGNRAEGKCLTQSLSSFSRFYETLSVLDVFESKEALKITDTMQSVTGSSLEGTLQAGVENSLANFPVSCETDLEVSQTYAAEIEARSLCKMYCEAENMTSQVTELRRQNADFSENFVLPVAPQNSKFSLLDNNKRSVSADYSRALDNTLDNLPHIIQKHTRTVHLDYLPALREICRTEQCRQISNTKRRFHHYLDSITMPLKDKTIATLATTFV